LSAESLVSRLTQLYGYNEFFAQKLVEALGSDALSVAESCEKPLQKAIRVNTLKTTHKKLVDRLQARGFKLEKIPWLKDGYWVTSEPKSPALGATHEYLFGHYFIQSPSSMYAVEALNPQPGETVLDIAAGAGGKTTHISQLMHNKGIVVAVEPKRSKVAALRSNVSRLGCVNTVILQMDGRKISELDLTFDRVLLDAPCTSSGVVARYPRLKTRISATDVLELSRLQSEPLDVAFAALKRGGVLVYSTCSYFKEEGEDVVAALLDRGAAVLPLKPPNGENQEKWVRFYTHKHKTEGFFVCRITKK